jgi:hypothetical protein
MAPNVSPNSINAIAVTTGSEVDFDPTGEHLFVCDTKADGHRADGFFFTSANATTMLGTNANGNGTCVDFNLSIAESGWIDFEACTAEGSTVLNSSGFTGEVTANG